VQRDGLALASIETLPADADAAVPESCKTCVRLLERIIEQQTALFEPPQRLDSASWVSGRLAEVLPLPLPTKQELLELSDAAVRLERLNALIRDRVKGS
jgi:Lon protease-like protein